MRLVEGGMGGGEVKGGGGKEARGYETAVRYCFAFNHYCQTRFPIGGGWGRNQPLPIHQSSGKLAR